MAELPLSEDVLVLQEERVHPRFNMIVTKVSQGFRLNNGVDDLDIVCDILDGIEILVS